MTGVVVVVVVGALLLVGYLLGLCARGREIKRRERQLAATRRALGELERLVGRTWRW